MEDTLVIKLMDGVEKPIQIEDLCYKDMFRIDGVLSKVIGWSFDSASKKPVLLTTQASCPDHMLRCRNFLRGGPVGIQTYPIIFDSYPKEKNNGY